MVSMNHILLEKYADLIVKTGVNIQGQTLVIFTIECALRTIAEVAYQSGARDVVIQYKDELFSKMRLCRRRKKSLKNLLHGKKEFYLSYVKQGAA